VSILPNPTDSSAQTLPPKGTHNGPLSGGHVETSGHLALYLYKDYPV